MSNRSEWAPLAAAFLVGMALRLALLFTTVGSTDSMHVTMWAVTAAKNGVAGSYALSPLINHPPLTLAALGASWRLAEAVGTETYQVVRAAQIIADIVTAFLLLLLGRRFGRGPELAILFFLTPVAIFISAFHCNTDPTMIMFLVAAVVALAYDRPIVSGLMLAASINIKIVPLLLVPLFVIATGTHVVRFLAAFSAAMAVGFVPALIAAGPVMIRNVFLYGGYPGEWGIPALMLLVGRSFSALTSTIVPAARFYAFSAGKWVAVGAIVAICVALWRRGFGGRVSPPAPGGAGEDTRAPKAAAGIPLLLLVLLTLAPGFGVQYLLWPLPLLPLLIPRRAYLLVAGIASAWLFYTYTIWSGGFPWWFADARQHFPGTRAYVVFGLVVWLTYAITAAVSLPRFLRRTAFETSSESAR